MAAARLLLLAQVPLAGAIGALFGTAQSPEPATVHVKVLGEAGCMFTRNFILGALNKTLTSKGFEKSLRFDFLPFGNAYFASRACTSKDSAGREAYSTAPRMCFNNHCGPARQQDRPEDCFKGQLVCQHGGMECNTNRYFACARKIAQVPNEETSRQSFLGYMPFFHCVVKSYSPWANASGLQSKVASCAAQTGQDFHRLQECFSGPDGDAAVIDAAKETPVHEGVPWIYINGQPMEADHENELFANVCQALPSGAKPEECGGPAETKFKFAETQANHRINPHERHLSV